MHQYLVIEKCRLDLISYAGNVENLEQELVEWLKTQGVAFTGILKAYETPERPRFLKDTFELSKGIIHTR